MDIISLKFAGLTVLSVLLFYLINPKYRPAYLAILSCGFIASFNYLLLPYILVFTLFNYYIGILLLGSKNKIVLFRTGIAINILQLVLLKYASFAIDPFFKILGFDFEASRLSEIIVPIGISYFTLQGIGYLINIKMGWEKPEHRFIDFLLYITFFPKFLSGPIERSNHFLPQLKESGNFNALQVSEGFRIALFGFLKKIAIANQLAPFISSTFNDINSADGFSVWLLLFLFPLYLYFDFSGYTDIAIGFARMFGINLLPNFNRPFFSENMTNFWKRFHISLSAWFGDYIYKQTVFKRRSWGKYASVYAVFITWILFGIWHGAGWNFMLLGVLQALAINYEYFTKKWRIRLFSWMPAYARTWFGRVVTYLFYGTALTFFFSPDLNSTVTFFSKLFTSSVIDPQVFLKNIPLSAIIIIIIYFFYELIAEDYLKFYEKVTRLWWGSRKINVIFRWSVYSAILSIIYVLGNEVQQFIYVQF